MSEPLFQEISTDIDVGTSVIVVLDNGGRWHTKTRSRPWQLGHGQWVVALEGKAGCYALSRVFAEEPHP